MNNNKPTLIIIMVSLALIAAWLFYSIIDWSQRDGSVGALVVADLPLFILIFACIRGRGYSKAAVFVFTGTVVVSALLLFAVISASNSGAQSGIGGLILWLISLAVAAATFVSVYIASRPKTQAL